MTAHTDCHTDPVFLASLCGEPSVARPSATALGTDDVYDYRFASLGAAVEFAKQNNLLGVLLDAGLLVSCPFLRLSSYNSYWQQVRVPSLIQGVKDLGLLVGTFGTTEDVGRLPTSSGTDAFGIDAALQDGVLTYFDHNKRS